MKTPERDKWAEELANAIIENACAEYRTAHRTKCRLQEFAAEFKLVLDPIENLTEARRDKWFGKQYRKYQRYQGAIFRMEEIEHFFQSRWYRELTTIDGKWLLNKLKESINDDL